MEMSSPMFMLRELAEKTLNEATTLLGQARQKHAAESARLLQLCDYETEYRRQLQDESTRAGVSVTVLQTCQKFIGALGKVIAQQESMVSRSQDEVDNALTVWQKDRCRLNAFETLQRRAEIQRRLKDNRLEQKMMDEFARRAGQGKN